MTGRVVVHLGVGSNIEPDRNVPAALSRLCDEPRVGVRAVSCFYASAPIGDKVGAARFINGVFVVETALGPLDLKKKILREIEHALGRDAANRSGPRPIDLDIITYDDWIAEEPELSLPDPHWLDRAFIAVPMAEVAPDLRHPVTGQTAAEIADAVDPTGMAYDDELTDRLRRVLAADVE